MLTLDQLAIHKEYRKYLRIQEGIKGNMLNTLINATEKSLPALIREHIKMTLYAYTMIYIQLKNY